MRQQYLIRYFIFRNIILRNFSQKKKKLKIKNDADVWEVMRQQPLFSQNFPQKKIVHFLERLKTS